MKIIHIAYSTDKITPTYAGGRGRFIYNLAKEQARNGHDVTVIAAQGSFIPGCKIHTVSKQHSLVNRFQKRIMEFPHILKSFLSISSEFDIVHNHVEWEGATLSRIIRKPFITTIHGLLTETPLGKVYSTACILPSKSKYVTYSKFAYSLLKDNYKDDLLGFIYPGIDTEYFRFNEKLEDDFLKLCCVGRLVTEKGFHNAIQVADKLHNKGIKLRLCLVASFLEKCAQSDRYIKRILKAVEKRSYIDIKVNASSEEVAETYRNSHATLMPIEWEELFGFVAAESLFCGTPVITFRRGALVELISNGRTGYLCKSLDEMTNSCLNINSLKRDECFEYAQRSFSVNAAYEGYAKVYEQLLS